MGNCIHADSGHSIVYDYTVDPDFWQLMYNLTPNGTMEDDWYQNFVEPCQYTFCSNFIGGIPVFLGITSLLGIVSNVALGIALAKCPRFWDGCQPGKAELSLLAVGRVIFASTLPFFALGVSWRWAFEDRLCQVIHGLKFGSLLAEGLLVAGTACRSPRGLPELLLPTLLWLMGFLCATPAALVSSTEGRCIPEFTQLHAWFLVHTAFCLGVLALLPLGVALATVCLKGCGRQSWNITWVFYLFGGPYAVAMFLNMLKDKATFFQSCRFLVYLNSFLGLSEGWGMLHCYLSPLLILGLGFYRRKVA